MLFPTCMQPCWMKIGLDWGILKLEVQSVAHHTMIMAPESKTVSWQLTLGNS